MSIPGGRGDGQRLRMAASCLLHAFVVVAPCVWKALLSDLCVAFFLTFLKVSLNLPQASFSQQDLP